jgi:hypothetical protein
VSGNWPKQTKKNADSTFPADLKIDPSSNSDLTVAPDELSAESDPGLKASQITITSYDWAAYGKLKVTAILDDKSPNIKAYVRATPKVKSGPGVITLTIPQDDDGNRIADVLDRQLGGGSASDDNDDTPIGDGTTGDGLSYWEEARGFRMQGKTSPTNPRKKDLFVFNPDKLDLSLFAKSGIVVHQVDESEFCSDCDSASSNHNVLNSADRGSARRLGDVHVVVIRLGAAGEGAGGASGCDGCSPKSCSEIRINQAQTDSLGPLGPAQLRMDVAHELAHCANVHHHGDTDYYASDVRYVADNRPVPKQDLGIPKDTRIMVAAPRGEESGLQECIMRYNHASALYEHAGGAIKWRKLFPSGRESLESFVGDKYEPWESPGTTFCINKTGTKAALLKAQNATRGNCAGQFCVNDVKGCKKF